MEHRVNNCAVRPMKQPIVLDSTAASVLSGLAAPDHISRQKGNGIPRFVVNQDKILYAQQKRLQDNASNMDVDNYTPCSKWATNIA